MANHIQNLQNTVNEQGTRIAAADDAIQSLRGYLASPKFTGESELQGYVSIKDVESRLMDIWRELHGLN